MTTFRECDYGVTILRRCDHRESVTPVVTHRVAGVCEAAAVWRVAVVRTRGHCTCYQHLAPTTPLGYIQGSWIEEDVSTDKDVASRSTDDVRMRVVTFAA